MIPHPYLQNPCQLCQGEEAIQPPPVKYGYTFIGPDCILALELGRRILGLNARP